MPGTQPVMDAEQAKPLSSLWESGLTSYLSLPLELEVVFNPSLLAGSGPYRLTLGWPLLSRWPVAASPTQASCISPQGPH